MRERTPVRIGIVLCGIAAIVILCWLLPFLREGILGGLSKAAVAGWGRALCVLLTVALAVWALTRAGLPSSQRDAGQDEGSDPQVALAFKKRRRLQLAVLRPLGVLLAVLWLGVAVTQEAGLLVIVVLVPPLLVLTIVALVVRMINWRCPACNKLLKGLNPTHCSKCGVGFRD
jgi:hypothetical protein